MWQRILCEPTCKQVLEVPSGVKTYWASNFILSKVSKSGRQRQKGAHWVRHVGHRQPRPSSLQCGLERLH